MKIRIGTRGSKLALAQAELVQQAILRVFPEHEAELVILRTKGDRVLDKSLSELGGSGVFVKELEQALLCGQIDLAVHSAKDMPVKIAEGLEIGGVLPRGETADVLVTRKEAGELRRIGTGSLRRQRFLKRLYPEAEAVLIRGNIDTRLAKLQSGEYDGIVLAAAGLARLGLFSDAAFAFRRFSAEEMLPAACQGIIAVECRTGEYAAVLQSISDSQTRFALETERHLLLQLGGDCSLPVGALAILDGDKIRLTATKDCIHVITAEAETEERLLLAERLAAKL